MLKTLQDMLNQMHLHGFSRNLEPLLEQHPEALEAILEVLTRRAEAESARRKERNVQYRIRQAQFGQIQTAETFDFGSNPSTLKIKNHYLKLLEADITRQGLSVLFVGTSGLGKTHLAKALGWRLCQRNYRVRFTTLSRMALNLTTADATGTLKKAMLAYTRPLSPPAKGLRCE